MEEPFNSMPWVDAHLPVLSKPVVMASISDVVKKMDFGALKKDKQIRDKIQDLNEA